MIAFFLAAQMLPLTPLPAVMEAPLNRYAKCINQRFTSEIARTAESKATHQQLDGSAIMSQAIAACSDERLRAIKLSERALNGARGFESLSKRRAFIRERFNGLDELFKWSVTREGDPDNWNEDAAN